MFRIVMIFLFMLSSSFALSQADENQPKVKNAVEKPPIESPIEVNEKKIEQIENRMKEIEMESQKSKDTLKFVEYVEYKDLQSELLAITKKAEEIKSSNISFAGFNWGGALGFATTTGRTVEAELVADKVRITSERKRRGSLMIETHYFVTPKIKQSLLTPTQWGIGPFVALEAYDTEERSFKGYAVGIMMGFKDAPSAPSSWNLGLGYYVKMNVRELGSGVEEGKVLPDGETSIRYKIVDKSGWMLIFSRQFSL